MKITQGYELDDLLLVPQPSQVNSRDDVDLSVHIKNFSLSIPIIASPMKGIVGVDIIKKIGELGGIGILHRFYGENDFPVRFMDLDKIASSNYRFGVAVGLNDNFYKEALAEGASMIVIDVANGYLDKVRRFTTEVANFLNGGYRDCLLMSGTVATGEGTRILYDAGADLVRVGLGSGQLCTTRKNTGVGVYQATALDDCSYVDTGIVADGGIRNSGDGVKCLALGADLLMMGSLFANCFESDHNGEIAGMASREFQEQFYGEVKKSVEGVQQKAVKKMSLEDLITEFVWNMKSGFTYMNARNIQELHNNAEFILRGDMT
jgi:IMP dehydrogenase/GMP reductase